MLLDDESGINNLDACEVDGAVCISVFDVASC